MAQAVDVVEEAIVVVAEALIVGEVVEIVALMPVPGEAAAGEEDVDGGRLAVAMGVVMVVVVVMAVVAAGPDVLGLPAHP